MKKILLLTLTMMLIFTGCSSETDEPETDNTESQLTIAENFANDLSSGNYSNLMDNYNYTTDMENAVSEQMYSDLIKQLSTGDFVSINGYKNSEVQGYQQVEVTFEYTDVIFVLNIVFDKTDSSAIAGINVGAYDKKK